MSVRDLFDLAGKVVLVTGGSRGLGLDMAIGLGEAGAAVVVTARREQWLTTAEAELRAKGIDPGKITRVAAGGYVPGLTMLEKGAVSASVIIEPLSILRKEKYRTVYKAGDVLKPMTTSVGITTPEFAKEHPDKLRAIIAGRRAGVQAIYQNPAEAGRILQKSYNLEADLATEAVNNMIAPQMWSEGEFNLVELDRMVDALKLTGDVKGDVDWSKLIDKSFLPADLQAKQ